MADNTDEEHLEIPTNMQSENLSDEIIPATDAGNVTCNAVGQYSIRRSWTRFYCINV